MKNSDTRLKVQATAGSDTKNTAESLKKTWGNNHANLFNIGADDNPQTKKDRKEAIKRRMSKNHKF